MKRIRRLLQPKRPATASVPAFASAVLVVVMTVVMTAQPPLPKVAAPLPSVPAIPVHTVEVAPPTKPATTATKTQNRTAFSGQAAVQDPYRIWLDEDVAYIITDAERLAFMNLRTNEERDAFVEQFWARRDPTPGTPVNEFKDEHYRRIAYADSHFATRLTPGKGWNTDRGQVYIKYGRPDELESHSAGTYTRPDGTTQPFASELWLYKYIQGVGNNVLLEFDDLKGTGEYHWTKAPMPGR